jgi:glucokinase
MRDTKHALGVDMGGTSIKVGIATEKGKIIKKVSVDTKADEGPDVVIKQIKKGLKTILKNNSKKIEGIGIGAPGSVILKKGTVENPPNLKGWEKVPLGNIIKKEFNQNVFVENDANAAAIGEMIFGAGKKLDNFIMVTLGTGVGGGIIINRKIYRGEQGAAGEIGHITVDKNGEKCNCGSIGCVEAYVGNNYLCNRVINELSKMTNSKINELIEGDYINLTPKVIHQAAELGDDYAKSVIIDVGRTLGIAIASTVNLLDISNVIVGGGVAGFGKLLFNSIEESIRQRVLQPIQERVKVKAAKLKNEAGIKGATALVFYRS